MRPALAAVLLVVTYYLWPLQRPGGTTLVSLISLAGLVSLFVWQARGIVTSPEPRLHRGVATSIPLFLVLFAGFYVALSEHDPEAFSEPLDRTGARYLTVTTLATVGFGDIVAVSQPARIAMMVQMVAGLTLLGVGVKVIIGAAQLGLRRAGRPERWLSLAGAGHADGTGTRDSRDSGGTDAAGPGGWEVQADDGGADERRNRT